MCDNIVAVGTATADGSVIFGKNSDREPNEAHQVIIIPRATHASGSQTHCTYIDIPQVSETHAVLLCRPSWLWGAEMGANEHGLAIGNTAVFTREPYDTRPGLTGMDYLRLALERTRSAPEALALITTLLEQYGQSGNNGFTHEMYYHNSFLIADPREAWALETVGYQWAAKQVKDIGATSNTLTIETDWDLASADLITYAQDRGWYQPGQQFNFKKTYSSSGLSGSFLYTVFGNGDERHRRLTSLLAEQKGQIMASNVMQALRDHGSKADVDYNPAKGRFQNPPCMHAGRSPVRVGQTTGSLVSHLTASHQTHWVTATAAPCTSVFKPVWIDAELPNTGQVPAGRYNRASLWWRHEALHRAVLGDYTTRLPVYQTERDEMERQFLAGAADYREKSVAERGEFSVRCFQEADQATVRWAEQVANTPAKNRLPHGYRGEWEQFNKAAGWYAGQRSEFAEGPGG